ncbi:MAG: hypothetical protein HRT47_03855 [Candidatus Caenarcaniphilales bacterium]|nr:hypothetical protein [Candidatus Caenarcaniphilales bacterium]
MSSLIDSLKNHKIFQGKANFNLVKCPGRISFSKHCDYVNNDLLYIAANYNIYAASAATLSENNLETFNITIFNLNSDFKDFELNLSKNYSKNEPQIDEYKSEWFYYVLKLLNELLLASPESFQKIAELYIGFNNNLPAAGGMSSSHALILSSMLSLSISLKIESILNKIQTPKSKTESLEILKLCQKIEHSKGFKSGLGDQAAQLLSQKDKFCFVKLYPKLSYSYIDIPNHLAFMILPSFIKAEKTSKEYRSTPKYFEKYSSLNEYWFKLLKNKAEITENLSEKENFHLGDLLYIYNDKELLELIGTIEDEKLKHLSLYALAEGARLKELKENFSENKLYSHINLSHFAENISKERMKTQETIDLTKKLSEHIGAYRASTAVNDELAEIALNIDGVHACSIMGAGLGGNNLAIVEKEKASKIKKILIKNYYSKKEEALEAEKAILVNTSSSSLEQII